MTKFNFWPFLFGLSLVFILGTKYTGNLITGGTLDVVNGGLSTLQRTNQFQILQLTTLYILEVNEVLKGFT